MKNLNYFQPTEIRFGAGRIQEVGEVAARYGKRCLLVTVPEFPAFRRLYKNVKAILQKAGVAVAHFDGVVPNPTTESITAGAKAAKAHKADVVLGLGGGSSMDSAKAIAVEATHKGTAWDYLFYKKPPTKKTLPIIAVSTTSGTGSQVTQVSVMTHTATRDKSAIYNSIVYPKVAIVDPELMLSLPPHITASTGFDAFCHGFEAYIHPANSAMVDMMALQVIRLVAENLPLAIADGSNLEARSAMAWADTLAGLCIANAGVTLPHGVGMAISGMYPKVMHGEALAIIYPAFMRFTYASAPERFAAMARVLDPALKRAGDAAAARKSCDVMDRFLKKIGMWLGLSDFGAPESEIAGLAKAGMVLPDYKNNPRLATAGEMLEMVKQSYRRA
jgi:alcohol dehydrogenase class IV